MTDIFKAKTMLSLSEETAYYAAYLMGVPIVKDSKIDTLCTNGISVYYNEDFVSSLTVEEVMFILVHEVKHILRQDMFRYKQFPDQIANAAADLVINTQQVRTMRLPMPKMGLIDNDGRYIRTWQETTEEICQKLMDEQSQGQNQQNQQNQSDMGSFRAPTPEELQQRGIESEQELKAEIIQKAIQTAMRSEKRGTLPAEVQAMIGDLISPKPSIWQILTEFMARRTRDGYSKARPNRRKLQQGIIAPGRFAKAMGPIVVAVDTSGSMTEEDMRKCGGGLTSLISTANPEAVHVLHCDDSIRHAKSYQAGEFIKLSTRYGGGGTDFNPVFDWVAKQGISPDVLIYFTDLEGYFPKRAPNYEVLWVDTRNTNYVSRYRPPFGTVVKFR